LGGEGELSILRPEGYASGPSQNLKKPESLLSRDDVIRRNGCSGCWSR
jgi:hypothetical protein